MNSSFFSLAWLTPSLACSTWLCLLVSILSCSTEQTVLRCANGPNPSGTGCATAGQSDVATDGTDSTTGSNNNLSGLADVTGGGTFVDDIVASENNDISASDIRVDGVCLPGVDNMDREMGQPCTAHTDCGTCYCYDEAYMTGTGFRFCTKDCSSGPGAYGLRHLLLLRRGVHDGHWISLLHQGLFIWSWCIRIAAPVTVTTRRT